MLEARGAHLRDPQSVTEGGYAILPGVVRATWCGGAAQGNLSSMRAKQPTRALILFASSCALGCGAESQDASGDRDQLAANAPTNAQGSPETTAQQTENPPMAEKPSSGGSEPSVESPAAPPFSMGLGALDPELPDNCRWHGFGIGPSGAAYCDADTHLYAHAMLPCLSELAAGQPVFHSVTATCSSGAQEVQARCCYPGTPPEKLDFSAAAPLENFKEIVPDSPVTVATLRALAAEQCRAENGGHLGDWYVQYQGNTGLGSRLQYDCVPRADAVTEVVLANFERDGSSSFVDLYPGFAPYLATLTTPRGGSTGALHLSGERRGEVLLEPHYHFSPRARGYTTLAFWARSDAGSVELQVDHGMPGDFAATWPTAKVKLTQQWERFEIPFSEMLTQGPTRPFEALEPTDSTQLRFTLLGAGQYSVWLDDISYLCGQGSCD